MHKVMDTLICHQVTFRITAARIAAQREQWNRAMLAHSRSDSMKRIAAFVGLELIDYDSALILKQDNGDHEIWLRSAAWAARQSA